MCVCVCVCLSVCLSVSVSVSLCLSVLKAVACMRGHEMSIHVVMYACTDMLHVCARVCACAHRREREREGGGGGVDCAITCNYQF